MKTLYDDYCLSQDCLPPALRPSSSVFTLYNLLVHCWMSEAIFTGAANNACGVQLDLRNQLKANEFPRPDCFTLIKVRGGCMVTLGCY